MSSADFEFHSPLTLLRQWEGRADGAPLRELLVLTYTLDLVFVERHMVATARALGARVTVLGDATGTVHDPVDVRHAGRTYQHGHAVCGGAFHPKLVLLVGDDECWAAVGSGNATMSGWGYNHELWLVLRSPLRERGPAGLLSLADWLLALPDVVSMPTWIADTVHDVGASIRPADADESLPDLEIFGNLHRPILTALPIGSVDSVAMTAPFFDPGARAVAALVGRMDPRTIDIAIQPLLSRYDGEALTAAAGAARFHHLPEERTTHGKLVEWTRDGLTTALMGSANLSAAGMLTSTADGGNCELVASHPVDGTLLPPGVAVEREVVRNVNTLTDRPEQVHTGRIVLLGARRTRDSMTVEFIADSQHRVCVDTSPDGGPDAWTPIHVVDAASVHARQPTVAVFPAPEQLGGAVRARSGAVVSTPVFLTDTVRCEPRSETEATPRLIVDAEFGSMITDEALATRFAADLLRLLSQVAAAKPPSTLARPTAPVSSTLADDRWGKWLHDTEQMLGSAMFKAVFPAEQQSISVTSGGWSLGPEVGETELTEDEDDSAIDSPEFFEDKPDTPLMTADLRKKWRQWTGRLRRGLSRELPLELRMAVTYVHIDLLAAGVWDDADDWRPALRDVVLALMPRRDEDTSLPDQSLVYTSSLAAVCLALLLQDANLRGDRDRDRIAVQAWAAAKDWAAFAQRDLVTHYLKVPKQAFARVATEGEVDAVIDLAEADADDPDATLAVAFRQEGLDVTLIGNVWVADGHRDARQLAGRVADLVGTRCAVLARARGHAAVILRENRAMFFADSKSNRWRSYRLSPVSTAQTLLCQGEGLPPAQAVHPLRPIPTDVSELAGHLEVDVVHLAAALLAPPQSGGSAIREAGRASRS
jgi:hypothetical protein